MPLRLLDLLLPELGHDRFFRDFWDARSIKTRFKSRYDFANYNDFAWVISHAQSSARRRPNAVLLTSAVANYSEDAAMIDEIEHKVASGASVVLNDVQEECRGAAEICGDFAGVLGTRIAANLYATPQHSRGLASHFDSHGVFVVQIAGSKEWTIGRSPAGRPLEKRPRLFFETDDGFRLRTSTHSFSDEALSEEDSVILRPGEVLYIPRGLRHQARATDSPSIHLTVGLRSPTVLDAASAILAEAAEHEEPLRDLIPAGVCLDQDLGRQFVEGLDVKQIMMSSVGHQHLALKSFMKSMRLSALSSSVDVNPLIEEIPINALPTRLERSPGLVCLLETGDVFEHLVFATKAVRTTSAMHSVLEFVSRYVRFDLHELPGATSTTVLKLIAKLVSYGVLSETSHDRVPLLLPSEQ